jgi:hypothetical protein
MNLERWSGDREENLFRICVHVLCFVGSMTGTVIQLPIGERCMGHHRRLVFAPMDDAPRQLVPRLITIARRLQVLFHITQVHTPETCPKDEGGSNTLFDPNVEGVKLIGRYGANAQHTMFYIVEADDVDALQKFLFPGFKRCTATITPVSEVPVPRD